MDFSKPITKRNPSRKDCEQTIRRILMTEVLEQGSNCHFKSAADFMKYFESLYLASPGLTKQVQRAIKAMNMPRDEKGYFIVNKTIDQFEQEKKIASLFEIAELSINPMEEFETVFLKLNPNLISYTISVLDNSPTISEKIITMVSCSNGILIYTQNKKQLLILLNSLTN